MATESEHIFYPAGQFAQDMYSVSFAQLLTDLDFRIGSYCLSAIIGFRVVVIHLLPYLRTILMCGRWDIKRPEPEYCLCYTVGYYSTTSESEHLFYPAVQFPRAYTSNYFSGETLVTVDIESLCTFHWGMHTSGSLMLVFTILKAKFDLIKVSVFLLRKNRTANRKVVWRKNDELSRPITQRYL